MSGSIYTCNLNSVLSPAAAAAAMINLEFMHRKHFIAFTNGMTSIYLSTRSDMVCVFSFSGFAVERRIEFLVRQIDQFKNVG